MSIARQFQDENARFQIQRGNGQDINAAAAFSDPTLVVGKGLYIGEWRDFSWKHIARIERKDDKVVFVYLDTTKAPDPGNKREGNVTTTITLTTVVEKTMEFGDNEEVLVCNQPVARPKNRRDGTITTQISEELPD
jgi:hypothetical protein